MLFTLSMYDNIFMTKKCYKNQLSFKKMLSKNFIFQRK